MAKVKVKKETKKRKSLKISIKEKFYYFGGSEMAS